MKRFAFVALSSTFMATVALAQTAPSVDPTTTTVISLGSWGATILTWVLSILAPVIATFLVMLLQKILDYFGVKTDQERRARLQEIIINGINLSAARLSPQLQGKLNVEVRSQFQREVIAYVMDHAPEILRDLKLDPKDPTFINSIEARIFRALNDPNSPTPAIVTPQEILDTQRPTRSGDYAKTGG